jgi:AcrR family transcriptional regulator
VSERRNERSHRAILDATVELLCEHGFGGLTVDGVAARAGVGKATIYRHWGSKNELAMEAIAAVRPVPAVPDTGSLRDDLRQLMTGVVRMLTDSPMAALTPSLIDAAERDDDLRALHQSFVSARRDLTMGVLRRAAERGEIAADVDPALVTDLLAGSLFYRRLLLHEPLDAAYVDRLVDLVLIAVRSGAPATTG